LVDASAGQAWLIEHDAKDIAVIWKILSRTESLCRAFLARRYKSVSVTTDKAMHEVLNYVHENPVKAKIVNRQEDYVYSSAYKYSNGSNELVNELLIITKYGDTSAGSCELIKG